MHFFLVTSENITVNHKLLKARFCMLNFCCRRYGPNLCN